MCELLVIETNLRKLGGRYKKRVPLSRSFGPRWRSPKPDVPLLKPHLLIVSTC